MAHPHLVVIGGGLAGLSAGVHARRSGFRTTIVEHNLALGGVCTAWHRGPYTIDGCIHWLTGGPFMRAYAELGIVPAVETRVLHTWVTYRHVSRDFSVPVTRDLDALVEALATRSPADAPELERVRQGARAIVALKPPLDAEELMTLRDGLHTAWDTRVAFGALVHFRKPVGQWATEHLESRLLRDFFCGLVPDTAPTMFLLMVLGYLEHGYLSRPVGGTAAFRDRLEHVYRGLGGDVLLPATVDEILVDHDQACGVRLADGRLLDADVVLSTASAPETVLRLLGGRYDAQATRDRLEHWRLFDPIVLASFGVEHPYSHVPSMQIIDGIQPFEIGGKTSTSLYVRTCNDDPCFAPPGHSVVQAMVPTSYEHWAKLGSRYNEAKDEAAQRLLEQLSPHFADLRSRVRLTDVATPLTYWGMARSWRGAYEGWMPTGDSLFGHVPKTLAGLGSFFMAGQWVEPGGGVPTAIVSGRKAVQLACAAKGLAFVPS